MSTTPRAHPVAAAPTITVDLPTPRSSISTSSSASPRASARASLRSGTATPWTYTTVVAPTTGNATGSATPREGKTLPLPPPVLQPLRKHETVGLGSPPRRRPDAPPAGLGLLPVLPGVLVALISAGSATSLFLYLAIRRDGSEPGIRNGFYVDEMQMPRTGVGGEPLLGLLWVTVITNLVWLVGFPVLLSLAAFCVAADWLSYQQRPRSLRPNLLSPLQYALLFKLFTSPGPGAVYHASSYLAQPRARIPAPAFFARGVVLAGIVLGVSYLVSIADMWLHAAAAVVVLHPPSQSPPLDPRADPILDADPSSDQAVLLRGHYPLAPVLTYLVLLYLHALLAAVLALRVAILRSPVLGAVGFPRSPSSAASAAAAPAPAYPPGLAPDVEPGSGLPTASTAVPVDAGDAATPTTSTAVYPRPHPSPPTALLLAHAQLTDALAPVAARLSTRRLSRIAGAQALFVEDANTARVEVGVWDAASATREARAGGFSGGKGGSGSGRRRYGELGGGGADGVFGVYRKLVAYRGEIY